MNDRPVRYFSFDHRDNYDARATSPRRARPIGTLVHSTDGVDSYDWLTGGASDSGSPASANCLITRAGDRYLICPDDRFPFHAGRSRFYTGRAWLENDDVSEALIGVELECSRSEAPSFAQLDSLAEYVVECSVRWQWRWPQVLLGHYAVATPLGRRSDPWLLDWGTVMGRLYARCLQSVIPGL